MESLEYCIYSQYNIYALPRGRQIASGIIVSVRKNIIGKFKTLHEMGDKKFEKQAVELRRKKTGKMSRILFINNPP